MYKRYLLLHAHSSTCWSVSAISKSERWICCLFLAATKVVALPSSPQETIPTRTLRAADEEDQSQMGAMTRYSALVNSRAATTPRRWQHRWQRRQLPKAST